MSQNGKPTAAFVLSLIAGILIIVAAVVLGLVSSFFSGPLSLLYERPEQALGLAAASTVLNALMVVGIIFGILVLLGAFMVYRNPAQKTAWGVIILVLSILSIVTGGGFAVGLILGIIGGALALAWKPKTVPAEPTTTATTTT